MNMASYVKYEEVEIIKNNPTWKAPRDSEACPLLGEFKIKYTMMENATKLAHATETFEGLMIAHDKK